MDKFATGFENKVIPFLNNLKAEGYRIYIRNTRKYRDGVVPNAIYIPGLPDDKTDDLWELMYDYDSEDHETNQTVIFNSEHLNSEGWVEI